MSANSSILGNSDLTFVDRKLGKCAFGSDSLGLIGLVRGILIKLDMLIWICVEFAFELFDFLQHIVWRTRWVGGLVGTDIRGGGLIYNMRGGTYCCRNGWCKNGGGEIRRANKRTEE